MSAHAFAKPVQTQRACDCGDPAAYQLSIPIGGHAAALDVRIDHLYLCPACYIIHLEMEIDHRERRAYQPAPAAFSDLAALLRRYIRLEQSSLLLHIGAVSPLQRAAHIAQARRLLSLAAHCAQKSRPEDFCGGEVNPP